jgi:O-antigen/teichoic acid export membrane protein
MKVIKNVYNNISQSKRNVVTLFSGTLIAQGIVVASSVLLARIYNPSQFGIYSSYFSALMILSPVICGKYELSIILPKLHLEGFRLTILSILISVIGSVFFLILFIPLRGYLEQVLKLPPGLPYNYLLSLGLCFLGINLAFNYWFNRIGMYKVLAINKITRSISVVILSVGFGLFGFKTSGLIVADIVGYFLANSLLIYFLLKWEDFPIYWFDKFETIALAKRYIRFPKYQIASGFLEKISQNAPFILIVLIYSGSIQGLFSMTFRVLAAPLLLITGSIGDVFQQKASVLYAQEGQCYHLFISTFKTLFTLSIIPFIILFFTVKPIFVLVLGQQWAMSGEYAQIMIAFFFFQFNVSHLSKMIIIAEKQHIDLIIQFFLVVAVISSIWIGKKAFNSEKISILLYSIVYIIKYIIEFMVSLNLSKGKHIVNTI